jgi:hypothetical protein
MAPRRDIPPRPAEAGPNWVYNPELGRWVPPDAAQPAATPAAAEPPPYGGDATTPGGVVAGDGSPPAAEAPPQGADDATLSKWLYDMAMKLGPRITQAQLLQDQAALALAQAQAAQASGGDPQTTVTALAALQKAQQNTAALIDQQKGYFAQLQPVQARLDKADARNDPQAQEERKQRLAALQAQIDANAAARKLSEAQLAKAMDPQNAALDRAYTQSQIDANTAQIAANTANTDWTNARIAAGEPQAGVDATRAGTDRTRAETDQINALIAAGMPEAQAKLVVAQARASDIAGNVSEEDLHQKQIGELGTLREQLQKQVDAGSLSASDARDILQAAVDKLRTGATPYDRQQQTAANSLAVARDAMQQGTLVNMGQPYATGAEPGGAYSQMSENLGYGPYSQPLNPTPLPRAIQSLGGDVTTPYTAGQLGLPAQGTPGGGPTSADSFTMSPAVQNGAGNVPPAVASVGQAAIDWSSLTWQQAKALLRSTQGAPSPQTPPQTTVPVVGG